MFRTLSYAAFWTAGWVSRKIILCYHQDMHGKIKLVVSDFHLSRGKWLPNGRRNPLEDFHQDVKFKEFLEHYSTDAHADFDVELIINGDFFDPLTVIPIAASLIDLKGLEFP